MIRDVQKFNSSSFPSTDTNQVLLTLACVSENSSLGL